MPELQASELDPDPIAQFLSWRSQAQPDPDDEVHAALATATPEGHPSVRMVLLKSVDPRGFVFYTNYRSRKGRELDANPSAALLAHWPSLNRQVRVEGAVARLTPEESDRYFRTRSPGSRLSAIASPQSDVIPDRAAIESRVESLLEQYRHIPDLIPRPAHWGGYRLAPVSVEFWQGRMHRLHDRFRYRIEGDAWRIERLAP